VAIPNPNPADVLGGQVWPSFFRKDLPTLRRRRSGDLIETGRKLNQSEPIPCSEPRAASAFAGDLDDKNSTGRAGRLSLDWWATIVAGVVVLLAVAGLLARIPW
jgi:hypothetical protein